jgi:hypothetical protein
MGDVQAAGITKVVWPGNPWPARVVTVVGSVADLIAITLAVTGSASFDSLAYGLLAILAGCIGLLWLWHDGKLCFVVAMATLVAIGLASSSVILINCWRADILPG